MGESSNKYLASKPRRESRNSMKDELLKSLRARRKEKVAEIHDTDSRMTKAQTDAVKAYETRVSKLKTERAGIIDADGRILVKSDRGTGNRTVLHTPRGFTAPNAVLTHNHPWEYGGSNLADRVGSTFSGKDLKAAVDFNLKAVRARTQGGYIYQIERLGSSWNVNPATLKREMDELGTKYVHENYAKTRALTNTKLGEYLSKGEIANYNELARNATMRANVAGQHRAMKELAKKYGFRYTRRKAD